MAKRKRLSPANPVFLSEDAAAPAPASASVARSASAPPIADVAGEASARAALEEVTQSLNAARAEGRMVVTLPLAEIDLTYLVRDRLAVADEDMQALITSLRARGQQTPIEVAPLEDGRYGLISGWRRCTALAQLYAETGAAEFASARALVRQPDQSAQAYLAMVEENEIRVGLSFYERARIVARTVENRVYPTSKEALGDLFAAASRAKRSKIKSFIRIVDALDGTLRFPQALGERLGLKLSKALEEEATLAVRLQSALAQAAPATAEAEQAVIVAALKPPARPSAPAEAQAAHASDVVPGVALKAGRNRLTLSGAALTPALQARLIDWLKSELS